MRCLTFQPASDWCDDDASNGGDGGMDIVRGDRLKLDNSAGMNGVERRMSIWSGVMVQTSASNFCIPGC